MLNPRKPVGFRYNEEEFREQLKRGLKHEQAYAQNGRVFHLGMGRGAYEMACDVFLSGKVSTLTREQAKVAAEGYYRMALVTLNYQDNQHGVLDRSRLLTSVVPATVGESVSEGLMRVVTIFDLDSEKKGVAQTLYYHFHPTHRPPVQYPPPPPPPPPSP